MYFKCVLLVLFSVLSGLAPCTRGYPSYTDSLLVEDYEIDEPGSGVVRADDTTRSLETDIDVNPILARRIQRDENQVKQLEKMNCRPRRVKVNIDEILKDTPHQFRGKRMYPRVLPVRRCLPECSFCGDDFGDEEKECVSVRTKKKKYTIFFLHHGQKQYADIRVLVDKECDCQYNMY